jgi:hypothetical protein
MDRNWSNFRKCVLLAEARSLVSSDEDGGDPEQENQLATTAILNHYFASSGNAFSVDIGSDCPGVTSA